MIVVFLFLGLGLGGQNVFAQTTSEQDSAMAEFLKTADTPQAVVDTSSASSIEVWVEATDEKIENFLIIPTWILVGIMVVLILLVIYKRRE